MKTGPPLGAAVFVLLEALQILVYQTYLQVRELVDAMQEKKVPKGCYVIREGATQRSFMLYYSIFVIFCGNVKQNLTKTQQKKAASARGPSLSSFTPSIGRGSARGTPPPPARMRGAPTSRQKQNKVKTVNR